jgi:hypothetical protein
MHVLEECRTVVPGMQALFGFQFIAVFSEADEVIEDILNFIDDVAIAEVVGTWEGHRFLWRTWETCRFKRAADLIHNPKVVRVSGWPATLDQRRADS